VASPSRARSGLLERVIPAAGWLGRYDRRDLPRDLIAGAVVAVMLIPQGMAYALLAGLPAVVGLYAATVPLALYALFGTSRQLAVGPVAIVALLTLTGASQVAAPGTSEFLAAAALLALMVGALQLILGLLRAGFVVNFLSHAVVSGFVSAAAIVIALSQLGPLLGLRLDATQGVVPLLASALARIGDVDGVTAALGVGSIAILLLLRRVLPRLPGPLLVVVLGTLVAFAFDLGGRGVSIVGTVPQGLPGLALPVIGLDTLSALLPAALTISFVGFMESFAVAKAIASKEGYEIDANRELVGLGVANLGAGAFATMPVTGGFSRSAVNYGAGARTPLASLVTAALIVLTLLFFTPLFHFLPHAVLAAIVIVAVIGLVDLAEPARLFRLKPVDGWTLVLTVVATLTVGIEAGILLGVAFSLLVFVWRSAYPHTAELGYLPRLGAYRNVQRYEEAERYPGTLILRVDASLYFANMAFLTNLMSRYLAERPELRYVLFDFSGVNDIDAVALHTLEGLTASLTSRGIEVHVAAMKGPVRDLTARAGWPLRFGGRIEHLSVAHAVTALGLEREAATADTASGRSRPALDAEGRLA
jgi:sulfate permease, SulP family